MQTHVGQSDEVQSAGSKLVYSSATAAIWGANQQTEESVCLAFKQKITNFKTRLNALDNT